MPASKSDFYVPSIPDVLKLKIAAAFINMALITRLLATGLLVVRWVNARAGVPGGIKVPR
jgi:putative effector of murein hydrolase LrgA (UPF0299 family)